MDTVLDRSSILRLFKLYIWKEGDLKFLTISVTLYHLVQNKCGAHKTWLRFQEELKTT